MKNIQELRNRLEEAISKCRSTGYAGKVAIYVECNQQNVGVEFNSIGEVIEFRRKLLGPSGLRFTCIKTNLKKE